MARGFGRAGSSRPISIEVQQNGEAPQSTLAAQLVNQLADSKRPPKNEDQETFRHLLREILDAKSDHGSQTLSHELDSDGDYKLIYVVVKAGLEAQAGDSPFSKQADYSKQAIDSLAAIEATVLRNPEVLYATASAQVLGSEHNGPLFLWLVPKLLTTTGQSQDETVTDSVLELFKTALLLESKMRKNTANKYAILKYMKGCFKGSYTCRPLESSAADCW